MCMPFDPEAQELYLSDICMHVGKDLWVRIDVVPPVIVTKYWKQPEYPARRGCLLNQAHLHQFGPTGLVAAVEMV